MLYIYIKKKLIKLGQRDFVFVSTDSRNGLWVTVKIKQNLPSWLNEGNICVSNTSFKR